MCTVAYHGLALISSKIHIPSVNLENGPKSVASTISLSWWMLLLSFHWPRHMQATSCACRPHARLKAASHQKQIRNIILIAMESSAFTILGSISSRRDFALSAINVPPLSGAINLLAELLTSRLSRPESSVTESKIPVTPGPSSKVRQMP